MAYGGHQFGTWVPQLGDGRGLLLGELRDSSGKLQDVHIKGAGPGHFSRGFDGRAVLRSTIREYLCSEAMHHLGIPTTRALCLIASEQLVEREILEKAALLVRIAESHVRFGTFEYFYAQQNSQAIEELLRYLAGRHFASWADLDTPDLAVEVLKQAILATARLIAHWQTAGFCHGVMNTDNMSILGETLDYGPYAFMDTYNPNFICNATDRGGRYAYNRQPSIGLWNCAALAETFSDLIADTRRHELLALYEPEFMRCYLQQMGLRLGMADTGPEDLPLISDFLTLLATSEQDYHLSFIALLNKLRHPEKPMALADIKGYDQWESRWLERTGIPDATSIARMDASNPKVVLRNYRAQLAIEDAEQGNSATFDQLLQALSHPYETPSAPDLCQPPPASLVGRSLSCSS